MPIKRLRPKPKLFELADWDMTRLAKLLGMASSQIYRVRQGKRGIHEKFIVGALTAFPEYKFEDLFHIEEEE